MIRAGISYSRTCSEAPPDASKNFARWRCHAADSEASLAPRRGASGIRTVRSNAARAACLPLLVLALSGASARQDKSGAAAAGFDANRLRRVDALVEAAIPDRLLPGAVVLVGRGDREALLKAYGNRAVVPSREAMTTDTIFDLASLTKSVATAARG